MFREGALEGPETTRVEAHLSVCADCRAELELLRLVAEEPVPDPGEAFWAAMPSRVYGQVLEQKERRSRWDLSGLLRGLALRRAAWATASVLIVASLAWLLVATPTKQGTDMAVLPQAALSAEETSSYEALDMASLDTDELENIGDWAERKMAAAIAETDIAATNGRQENIYEELVEMDGASLKRLSSMLDGMKERGQV